MLLTGLAAIRTDLGMCAFMAIEMFLLMTDTRTKTAFLLHREFEPQRHLGLEGEGVDRRVRREWAR
jgi:hypothetical protein